MFTAPMKAMYSQYALRSSGSGPWAIAIERRAEALIDLDRHGEALSQLAGLVESHPLRERPRGLQMLALYHDGRQASGG